MRKRSLTNSKQKSSNKKSKNNEDNSYNYYTSSKENLTKICNEIKIFLSTMKECFKSLKNSFFRLISKLSFLTQSIIIKVPIITLILVFLGGVHVFIFEQLYFYNYYNIIKKEYLNKLTNEIDNKYFELDNLQLKQNFDEAEELLFFNIYFKELVDMGLADERDINKNSHVFQSLNSQTSYLYSSLTNITNQFGMNNNYDIPKEYITDYIYESHII